MAEDKSGDLRLTPAALVALADGNTENFMAAVTPGGIEAQEARGQRDFVRSTTLPFEIRVGGSRYAGPDEFWPLSMVMGWKIAQVWGIRFGHFDSDVDPLFVDAELPTGWEKVPTGHSMWSILVDDRGRHRAGIFYKAAFYDRNAHMNLDSRIQYEYDYDREREEGVCVARVIADKRGHSRKTGYKSCIVLYETEPVKLPFPVDTRERSEWQKNYKINETVREQAMGWADENYPYWEDPAAYWDMKLDGKVVDHG